MTARQRRYAMIKELSDRREEKDRQIMGNILKTFGRKEEKGDNRKGTQGFIGFPVCLPKKIVKREIN